MNKNLRKPDILRDYSQGLTPQEHALLASIRRAGYDLMTVILENQRSGQHWQTQRGIVKRPA